MDAIGKLNRCSAGEEREASSVKCKAQDGAEGYLESSYEIRNTSDEIRYLLIDSLGPPCYFF